MFLSLLDASFLRTKTLKRIENTFYGEKFYGEKKLSLLGFWASYALNAKTLKVSKTHFMEKQNNTRKNVF